jgi:SAM-dependent methyltransferase
VPYPSTSLAHVPLIRDFFDRQYAAYDRYWWRDGNRYSTSPADHTSFNAAWLAEAARRRPGRALDLGAGEGADSIRLARLGYQVDAIEISGFGPHVHSHVKLIAARNPEPEGR